MGRRVILVALQVILVLIVAALIFDLPLALEGLIRKESFFQGKPTTFWRHQLQGRGPEFHRAFAAFERAGPAGIDVLLEILATGSSTEKQGVIAILKGMGVSAKSAVPALNVMLEDRDNAMRVQAADSIFEINQEADDLIPTLILALEDDRDEVCKEAASLLGRMGPAARPAVPALVAGLRNEKPRVREWSAAALSKLGSSANTAVPALERACQDEHAGVAAAASAALREIRLAGATVSPQVP